MTDLILSRVNIKSFTNNTYKNDNKEKFQNIICNRGSEFYLPTNWQNIYCIQSNNNSTQFSCLGAWQKYAQKIMTLNSNTLHNIKTIMEKFDKNVIWLVWEKSRYLYTWENVIRIQYLMQYAEIDLIIVDGKCKCDQDQVIQIDSFSSIWLTRQGYERINKTCQGNLKNINQYLNQLNVFKL